MALPGTCAQGAPEGAKPGPAPGSGHRASHPGGDWAPGWGCWQVSLGQSLRLPACCCGHVSARQSLLLWVACCAAGRRRLKLLRQMRQIDLVVVAEEPRDLWTVAGPPRPKGPRRLPVIEARRAGRASGPCGIIESPLNWNWIACSPSDHRLGKRAPLPKIGRAHV